MRLRQPIWPRFLPTDTVTALATLGPVGRRLPAPGTWGSLAGLLFYVVFFLRSDGLEGILVTVFGGLLSGYFAVAICGEAEFRLAQKDPGQVILDEFVAMPWVFLGMGRLAAAVPSVWVMGSDHLRLPLVAAVGFLLFRFFDILKPLGISKLQDLPAGWGVVLDDTAAALAACAVMHAARLIHPFL
jgi:phosphatidylglycerophosphatase A